MKTKTKRGSALLLTTILMFVILSMVVSLTYVTVMEQKMSQKTKSSVGAFYGAESGVEWALNKIANPIGSSPTISSTFGVQWDEARDITNCPFGGCSVYLLKSDGKVITAGTTPLSEVKAIRSVGDQGGETQRAIEAAVAQAAAEGDTVCPSNFTNIRSGGHQLGCMETAEHGTNDYWSASNTCFTLYGGRLPILTEWYIAMNNYSLTDEADDWEFLGNSDHWGSGVGAGIAGSGGITNVTAHYFSTTFAYRCWIPR